MYGDSGGREKARDLGRLDGGLVAENGVKGRKQGWVDDLLKIGWDVAGAPCSCHPVDQCGLMGMVVESAGIAGVIICPLFEGSIDEVVDQVVVSHSTGGNASFHHFLSFSQILLIPLGGVPGQGSADGIFALGRATVTMLEAIDDTWQEVAVSVLVAVTSTSFTLAVLAFQALLRVTITRSAARWTGPVVTAQTGCLLGGMDGSCGGGGRSRTS